MVASIAAGILLAIGGLGWIERSADDGKAELERAIADLSAVPAPGDVTLQGRAVNACRRDDLDGNTEPQGSADYRWEKGALTASNLDTLEDWYLPKWQEQGWSDGGQAWETPPGFSIAATIAEPIC